MSEARDLRLRIGEAIQADAPELDELDQTAICTGWVVVAEWMDTKGARWLSKNSGDAAGEGLTSWSMNGMLHEALVGEWPDDA